MSDNELIAEFMGGMRYAAWKFPDDYHLYMTGDLIYHRSWDWLMPVVEKISGLYYADGDEYGYNHLYNIEFAHALLQLQIDTPIEDVYREVIRSIKWYNQTKKP